ncbi:hypothetical protein CsSME_00044705 [Camellia sinensis var. sinensis]
MSLAEMANLFYNFRLMICPGLDPNANNLVASTIFFSESTRAMLCLIRIETDPADRTQLRMTVALKDPLVLSFHLRRRLLLRPTLHHRFRSALSSWVWLLDIPTTNINKQKPAQFYTPSTPLTQTTHSHNACGLFFIILKKPTQLVLFCIIITP